MPYKYTGKEYDPETKLIYFGARYYDAKLSRWISVDPILGSYLTGKPAGGVYNPINLNLYNYCANNPVRYIDPNGKLFVETRFMWFADNFLNGVGNDDPAYCSWGAYIRTDPIGKDKIGFMIARTFFSITGLGLVDSLANADIDFDNFVVEAGGQVSSKLIANYGVKFAGKTGAKIAGT